MEVNTQRVDHLGIVAGMIKDLGLIELINQRIPTDNREEISTGEAVAGMILNGLGFSLEVPMVEKPVQFRLRQNLSINKL